MSAPTERRVPIAPSPQRLGILLLIALLLAACSATTRSPNSTTTTADRAAQPAGGPAILANTSITSPVVANAGMVVSQNALATQVGRDILRAGGNAIDAAVAVGFALAVTLPRAGNIGGSGFMLFHEAGASVAALDFRSAAPRAFRPEKYRLEDGSIDRDRLKFGAHAIGVPGTVAGLAAAWKRGGSMDWAALLAPAIGLARDGIRVSHDLELALASEQAVFARFPASRAKFLTPDGQALAAGELWRQPDLAATLQVLAEQGAASFYRGTLARALVAAVQADGGYLSLADLQGYEAQWRTPLEVAYRGKRVVAMPPVSGGGVTLLQMLNILGQFDLSQYPQGSAASLHLLAETMKRGAANRRVGIGDPDFVTVRTDVALSPETGRTLAAEISLDRATPVAQINPLTPPASRDTTHYSVVDQWGNAVAVTYTLGYSFGSGYVAPGTGILFDNQLRNFSYESATHANAPAPGKRMMSTMTPTMVFGADDQLELVTGTPGGGRIINVLLQLLVNCIDYDMNIASATQAPRIHQPWRSPELTVEPGFSRDTVQLLESRGHSVLQQASMGSTQSIALKQGLMFGAADPRRPGALAAGLSRVGETLVETR